MIIYEEIDLELLCLAVDIEPGSSPVATIKGTVGHLKDILHSSWGMTPDKLKLTVAGPFSTYSNFTTSKRFGVRKSL